MSRFDEIMMAEKIRHDERISREGSRFTLTAAEKARVARRAAEAAIIRGTATKDDLRIFHGCN
jgi:hypothetical protein